MGFIDLVLCLILKEKKNESGLVIGCFIMLKFNLLSLGMFVNVDGAAAG